MNLQAVSKFSTHTLKLTISLISRHQCQSHWCLLIFAFTYVFSYWLLSMYYLFAISLADYQIHPPNPALITNLCIFLHQTYQTLQIYWKFYFKCYNANIKNNSLIHILSYGSGSHGLTKICIDCYTEQQSKVNCNHADQHRIVNVPNTILQ